MRATLSRFVRKTLRLPIARGPLAVPFVERVAKSINVSIYEKQRFKVQLKAVEGKISYKLIPREAQDLFTKGRFQSIKRRLPLILLMIIRPRPV